MAGKGLDKEMKCSEELQAIVKEKKLSRKEVTKSIWKHIKKHKLNQKHEDGRIIQCDERMEPIFKKLIKDKRTIEMRGKKIKIPKGAIFMTEIAGAISKHLS
jgi:chromatin remodeling complex protein RSC6